SPETDAPDHSPPSSTMRPQLQPLALALALLAAVPPRAQAGKEPTRLWACPLSPSGVGPGLGLAGACSEWGGRLWACPRAEGSLYKPLPHPRGGCISAPGEGSLYNQPPHPKGGCISTLGRFLWIPRLASGSSQTPVAGWPPPRGTARPDLACRGAGGEGGAERLPMTHRA
uniref:Uncharacterized protein n=1 Tax=Gopherus agassizii TaxID=38772 RepID=A0A452GK99_9SAUR